MGNSNCKHVMKKEMMKETFLYKSKPIFILAITSLIWQFKIRNEYESYNKWFIMPSSCLVATTVIITTLFYILSNLSINQFELNTRIYKCMQWQNYHQYTCPQKKKGKCVIYPNQVLNWTIPNTYNKILPNNYHKPLPNRNYQNNNYQNRKNSNAYQNRSYQNREEHIMPPQAELLNSIHGHHYKSPLLVDEDRGGILPMNYFVH